MLGGGGAGWGLWGLRGASRPHLCGPTLDHSGQYVEHGIGLSEHLIVCEPDDLKVVRNHQCVATRVALYGRVMDGAVDFNHKPCGVAVEVRDEWANRVLTPDGSANGTAPESVP